MFLFQWITLNILRTNILFKKSMYACLISHVFGDLRFEILTDSGSCRQYLHTDCSFVLCPHTIHRTRLFTKSFFISPSICEVVYKCGFCLFYVKVPFYFSIILEVRTATYKFWGHKNSDTRKQYCRIFIICEIVLYLYK